MNTKDIKTLEKSNLNFKLNQKALQQLKKKPSKFLDNLFHEFHHNEFKTMDCLSCANCCKTTSPIFKDSDIKRISKKLKIKEVDFIDKFLYMDNDRDYVLQKSPCAFLNNDNTCDIYEFRPLACKEYPHTNRKNMYQILNLTMKNSLICPAVSRIVHNICSSTKTRKTG